MKKFEAIASIIHGVVWFKTSAGCGMIHNKILVVPMEMKVEEVKMIKP